MSSVSIIISSYNCATYLPEAVECALAQSQPCQVIVVDNGSEDESMAILARYQDRIEVIRQENLGEAGAIHTGLQSATGDIIIVLDADDLLDPDCAATVLRHFRPGMAKLQYCLRTVDAEGQDRKITFPHYPDGLNARVIHRINIEQGGYLYPITCGNAYARSFLAQILPVPDARFTFNADGYINRLASLYGDVECLPTILGAYRVHGRNFWARNDRSAMWGKQLRDELDRQQVFEQHAGRVGIKVPEDALWRNVRHLEVRILSLRFAPENHPAPGDRRRLLLRRSMSAAWHTYGLTPFGRLAWAGYLTFVTLAPLPVLHQTLPAWRGSSMRSLFARALLTATRLKLLPGRLQAWSKGLAARVLPGRPVIPGRARAVLPGKK